MTAVEKYQAERNRISEALKLAGVAEILYNKDNIPKNLPCAILILDSETGKHGTSRQYVDTDIAWTVFQCRRNLKVHQKRNYRLHHSEE